MLRREDTFPCFLLVPGEAAWSRRRGPAVPAPRAAALEQVPPENAPASQHSDGLAAPSGHSALFACKWLAWPPSPAAFKANRDNVCSSQGWSPDK